MLCISLKGGFIKPQSKFSYGYQNHSHEEPDVSDNDAF